VLSKLLAATDVCRQWHCVFASASCHVLAPQVVFARPVTRPPKSRNPFSAGTKLSILNQGSALSWGEAACSQADVTRTLHFPPELHLRHHGYDCMGFRAGKRENYIFGTGRWGKDSAYLVTSNPPIWELGLDMCRKSAAQGPHEYHSTWSPSAHLAGKKNQTHLHLSPLLCFNQRLSSCVRAPNCWGIFPGMKCRRAVIK